MTTVSLYSEHKRDPMEVILSSLQQLGENMPFMDVFISISLLEFINFHHVASLYYRFLKATRRQNPLNYLGS